MDRLRKCVALLSVLLLLTAVRCMANCTLSDAGNSAHVPPCHRHSAPEKCQSHPGSLAFSFQPAIHADASIVVLNAVTFEITLPVRQDNEFILSAHSPPLHRPPVSATPVLRI